MNDTSQDESSNSSWGCMADLSVASAVLIAAIIGLYAWSEWKDRDYREKSKLVAVISTFDSVESGLDKMYQKTHQPVQITTVVTQVNKNTPATKDWKASGFDELPNLYPEVSSLRITPDNDIIVVLDRFGDGIDGTEVRAHANRELKGTTWIYTCSSEKSRIRDFFKCR